MFHWLKKLQSSKFSGSEPYSKLSSKNTNENFRLSEGSSKCCRRKSSRRKPSAAVRALLEARTTLWPEYNESYCYLPAKFASVEDKIPPRAILEGRNKIPQDKGVVIRYYCVYSDEELEDRVGSPPGAKTVKFKKAESDELPSVDDEDDFENANNENQNEEGENAERFALSEKQRCDSEESLRTRILKEYQTSHKRQRRKNALKRMDHSHSQYFDEKRCEAMWSLESDSESYSSDEGADIKIPLPQVLKANLKYYGKDEDKVSLFKNRTQMVRLKRSMIFAMSAASPTADVKPSVKNIFQNGIGVPFQLLRSKLSNKFHTWNRNQWPN